MFSLVIVAQSRNDKLAGPTGPIHRRSQVVNMVHARLVRSKVGTWGVSVEPAGENAFGRGYARVACSLPTEQPGQALFATRGNHELSSQHRGAKSLVILSPAEVFHARATSTLNGLAFPTGFMS